jgi:hypothetical protein
VSFVSAGRVISFSVAATLLSESTFRNGDWLRETLSAVLERVVKHRIAGTVGEVGEHDSVFIRERSCVLGLARAEVKRSRDCHRKYYDGGNQNLPEFPARDGNSGRLHPAR